MNSVTDKVIVVTGGGQGLGEQITTVLAENGALVVPVDIKEEQVQKVAQTLTEKGYQAHGMRMDVGDEKNVQEVIDSVIKQFGRIDVIVNNAGIDVTKSIDEISLEEFDRVIRVNLRGPFVLSKIAFEKMKNGGHIVNITSTAAKRSWANASAYHASKWGLLGMGNGLHVEGREKNIKVTSVIAGGMRTPFILERFPDTPLDVLQDPRNVAETVHFVLTAPEGSVIPEVMVIPTKETSWP